MSKDQKRDVFDRQSRSQTKGEGFRKTFPRKSVSTKFLEENIEVVEEIKKQSSFKNISFNNFGVPIDNYRKSKDRDCSFIVIFSGGKKREKDYFRKILEEPIYFPRIKIAFYTGTDQVDELFLAIKEKKTKLGFDEEIGDDFYIISDVDDFSKMLKKHIPLCNEEKINLIISNPCFEIWLYYSYFDYKPDFMPSCEEKKSSELKKYLHKKIKGGICPNKEIFNIDKAIENSLKNYSEIENGFPDFLSTQMHLLAERIKPFMNEELVRLEEEIAKKRK